MGTGQSYRRQNFQNLYYQALDPAIQGCIPCPYTMQRHLVQLRQQKRESLKFLTKRRRRKTLCSPQRKQNMKNTQSQRKTFSKVSFLEPGSFLFLGPVLQLGLEQQKRIEGTICTSSLLNETVPTQLPPTSMRKTVQQTMKDIILR